MWSRVLKVNKQGRFSSEYRAINDESEDLYQKFVSEWVISPQDCNRSEWLLYPQDDRLLGLFAFKPSDRDFHRIKRQMRDGQWKRVGIPLKVLILN